MYNLLEEQTLTHLHIKLAEQRQEERRKRKLGTGGMAVISSGIN
jgi:hypothetical protein